MKSTLVTILFTALVIIGVFLGYTFGNYESENHCPSNIECRWIQVDSHGHCLKNCGGLK